MKTQHLNQEKFQISGYANSTHVSILKVGYPKGIENLIFAKTQELFDKSYRKRNISFIPNTIWPYIIESMKKFNQKISEPFVHIYYDHQLIGMLQIDLKEFYQVCNACGKEYFSINNGIRNDLPVLTKWQKFIKIFFKEAFEPTIIPLSYESFKCSCGCEDFTQEYR
jgi:hypothetical protein